MWPTNTHVGGDTTDIGVCATLGMKVKLKKLQLCQLCHTPPSWSTPQGLSCRVLRCQRTPSKSQCRGWLPCELLDQRGEPDQIWILSCREDWWQSVMLLFYILVPQPIGFWSHVRKSHQRMSISYSCISFVTFRSLCSSAPHDSWTQCLKWS